MKKNFFQVRVNNREKEKKNDKERIRFQCIIQTYKSVEKERQKERKSY